LPRRQSAAHFDSSASHKKQKNPQPFVSNPIHDILPPFFLNLSTLISWIFPKSPKYFLIPFSVQIQMPLAIH
jgi:hypothetical protein